MGSTSTLLSSATSAISQYASTSISLAPFEPAIVASITPSPTISVMSNVISSATALAATIATNAAAVSKSGDDSDPGADNGECQLLGPFAIIIQAALGGMALLVLVYKRWRERPQRPLKIWSFDVSKQVVGSVLLHLVNLLMSMLSSGQLSVTAAKAISTTDVTANPCSFYLLNLAIDTTIGIPILIILLRLLTHGFSLTPLANPPESIQSGNYGQPPKASWWLKQCLIYFIGLLGMKACVYLFFKLCPWIINVGDWALRWTEGNEQLQVFFVMLFFPVIMNAIQYYIIDGFIKNQKPSDHEPIPSEDGEADEHGDMRANQEEQDDRESSYRGEDDAEIIKNPSPQKPANLKSDSKKLDEYDPDLDGEISPTAVESESSSHGRQEDQAPPGSKVQEEDPKKSQ